MATLSLLKPNHFTIHTLISTDYDDQVECGWGNGPNAETTIGYTRLAKIVTDADKILDNIGHTPTLDGNAKKYIRAQHGNEVWTCDNSIYTSTCEWLELLSDYIGHNMGDVPPDGVEEAITEADINDLFEDVDSMEQDESIVPSPIKAPAPKRARAPAKKKKSPAKKKKAPSQTPVVDAFLKAHPDITRDNVTYVHTFIAWLSTQLGI